MQKKLIALAVTGLLSTGAFAQSSAVTVYGIADLSFDIVKTSGDSFGKNTGSYSRVSSNGSYIGFKGTEDLGNGLKALFQLETGLAVDSDNGNNSLFGNGTTRDSFVGLSGGFGEVKLGTLTTPTRALGTAMDVNAGSTSIGDNKALLNRSGFDTRQGNTVQYTSPSMAGFSAAVAYVSGEDKSRDWDAGTWRQENSRAWDLGLNYNNGPILLGLAYVAGEQKDVDDTKLRNLRATGAYDFGVASVRLIWDQVKYKDNTGLDEKSNVWGIGGTYNVVPNGKLIAQFYKAQDWKSNGVKQADTGAKLFEVGYEHSLSKRTMLKLVYARINNDSDACYDFATNGGIDNGASGWSCSPGLGRGLDPSGFQVGIRHSF